MQIPLHTDVVILLGVSLGVLYLSHGVRLPAIVGFLVTGVLRGPHGLAVVQSVHEVEQPWWPSPTRRPRAARWPWFGR